MSYEVARRGPTFSPNAWDLRAAVRALITAIGAWLVCFAVVAATDEGNVSWSTRLGRSLVTLPVCAAIGAGLTLSSARSHGELRALEAIGRREVESARPAIMGAVAPTMVLAALALAAVVDVSGFFPSSDARKQRVHADDAGFVDDDRGLRIAPSGEITVAPTRPAPGGPRLPASARLAVALTLAAGSLAFARVAARSRERRRWVYLCGLAVALTIALFQLAATGRLPPAVTPLPLAALVAWIRYRAADD